MSNATEVRLPSERKFGVTFTIFLAAVGIAAALRHWSLASCVAALTASGITGVITITAPGVLAPLNKGWFYLGEAMGKIVSPIVLGIIFFGLLTPIATVARLLGRDELRLRHRGAGTYWIFRAPPSSMSESFKHQF